MVSGRRGSCGNRDALEQAPVVQKRDLLLLAVFLFLALVFLRTRTEIRARRIKALQLQEAN